MEYRVYEKAMTVVPVLQSTFSLFMFAALHSGCQLRGKFLAARGLFSTPAKQPSSRPPAALQPPSSPLKRLKRKKNT